MIPANKRVAHIFQHVATTVSHSVKEGIEHLKKGALNVFDASYLDRFTDLNPLTSFRLPLLAARMRDQDFKLDDAPCIEIEYMLWRMLQGQKTPSPEELRKAVRELVEVGFPIDSASRKDRCVAVQKVIDKFEGQKRVKHSDEQWEKMMKGVPAEKRFGDAPKWFSSNFPEK